VEDPRQSLSIVELQPIEHPSEAITRVLAPNPSPMTLDGTNSYLIFSESKDRVLVVDPGPSVSSHLDALEGEIASVGAKVGGIVVTHSHIDHAESVLSLVRRWEVPAFAHPELAHMGYEPLTQGHRLLGGVRLEVLYTPGHSKDHLCFLDPEGNLLSGDHILGRGTTVVAHPDGDLTRYLESLEKVLKIDYSTIQPGHGPSMSRGLGQEVIEYYLDHRRKRLAQIAQVMRLKERPVTLSEIVKGIYGDLKDPILWAASATTMAALDYLIRTGEVESKGDWFTAVG
jgi:glyoxylase-like metal-dependent hydrolase (beta-lactamase superfamily II)